VSLHASAVRLRGDHSDKEEAMKYMLLIQQGDTPTPQTEEWERLSEEEQKAVYEGYGAINATVGALPACGCSRPRRRPRCV
jgi:hypothetical protein